MNNDGLKLFVFSIVSYMTIANIDDILGYCFNVDNSVIDSTDELSDELSDDLVEVRHQDQIIVNNEPVRFVFKHKDWNYPLCQVHYFEHDLYRVWLFDKDMQLSQGTYHNKKQIAYANELKPLTLENVNGDDVLFAIYNNLMS